MIRIGETTFDAKVVTALDGSMSIEFESQDTLDDIEGVFSVGAVVELIEGEEITARYYNKELKSLAVTGRNPRNIRVVLVTSHMEDTVETKIKKAIKEQGAEIADLTETVSGISESAELNDEAFGDLAQTISDVNDNVELTNTAFQELAELIADAVSRIEALETPQEESEVQG